MAEIDVGPLREAFEASGLSTKEIARRTGRSQTYIARVLNGTRPCYVYENGRRSKPYYCTTVRYETAEMLARVIGADPIDVGL